MSATKWVMTLVVGLSLLQAGLAGVAFYSRGQSEQAVAVGTERVTELEQMREREAERPADDRSAAAQKKWQLLDGPDVVTTLQVLQSLGDAAGVTFEREKALRTADAGKQPFVITGRGTPQQVCTFLAGIETNDRLMIVETGRILPANEAQVAFEIGVATYHRRGE